MLRTNVLNNLNLDKLYDYYCSFSEEPMLLFVYPNGTCVYVKEKEDPNKYLPEKQRLHLLAVARIGVSHSLFSVIDLPEMGYFYDEKRLRFPKAGVLYPMDIRNLMQQMVLPCFLKNEFKGFLNNMSNRHYDYYLEQYYYEIQRDCDRIIPFYKDRDFSPYGDSNSYTVYTQSTDDKIWNTSHYTKDLKSYKYITYSNDYNEYKSSYVNEDNMYEVYTDRDEEIKRREFIEYASDLLERDLFDLWEKVEKKFS